MYNVPRTVEIPADQVEMYLRHGWTVVNGPLGPQGWAPLPQAVPTTPPMVVWMRRLTVLGCLGLLLGCLALAGWLSYQWRALTSPAADPTWTPALQAVTTRAAAAPTYTPAPPVAGGNVAIAPNVSTIEPTPSPTVKPGLRPSNTPVEIGGVPSQPRGRPDILIRCREGEFWLRQVIPATEQGLARQAPVPIHGVDEWGRPIQLYNCVPVQKVYP